MYLSDVLNLWAIRFQLSSGASRMRSESFLDILDNTMHVIPVSSHWNGLILDTNLVVRKQLFEMIVGSMVVENNEDTWFEVVVRLDVDLDAAQECNLSVLDELLVVDYVHNVVADMLEHNICDLSGCVGRGSNAGFVFVEELFDIVHLTVARQYAHLRKRVHVLNSFISAETGTTSCGKLLLTQTVVVAADVFLRCKLHVRCVRLG